MSLDLQLSFRHPGEACIVLKALVAAYERVAAVAAPDELDLIGPYVSDRLAQLRADLQAAQFDLVADELSEIPSGHA